MQQYYLQRKKVWHFHGPTCCYLLTDLDLVGGQIMLVDGELRVTESCWIGEEGGCVHGVRLLHLPVG